MKGHLGHYEIVAELGRGGMGVVHKALDPALGRVVAIKELAPALADDPGLVERFLREARSMAALSDPHIVGIHFIGQENGRPFFVMEFVEGEALGGMLRRLGKLPVYHGHELPQGMSSPVNPARGLWMRVQESLICGHWHRTSEHTESTGLEKRLSSCWSLGCLCDLSPDYAIVNRWNHGFAVVDVEADGNYEVHNHKIIKGKVY